MPISQVTSAFLMAQFVGIFGAIGFGRLAARIGAKLAIATTLAIWAAILIYIYGFVYSATQFFFVTAGVAIVMGGSQALSRSLFAQLIPKGKEAEYFSIYEISDKGTSWMGPAFYGLALQWTGSYRIAILSLIVFFVVGLAILTRVNVERGERDVAGSAMADPYRAVGARHASPGMLMNHRRGIQLIREIRVHRLDNLAVAVQGPGIARAVAIRTGQDHGDGSARIP